MDGVRTWYPTIAKPSWTPPDAVFGPVWTVLYLAMGFAAWRVWRRGPSPRTARALTLFGVQLGLNAAWSPIFFALHRPAVALAVIVALDVTLVATLAAFRRVDRVAALLLAPYLLWCLFATALNAAIVHLGT
jgi:tryptophan-rich sensory protein